MLNRAILLNILIFLAVINVNAEGNGGVTLTGATISDACHGYICHGPAKVGFKLFTTNDSLMVDDSSANPQDGFFRLENLQRGESYKFVVTDSAFLNREYIISIPETAEYEELSRDLLIVPSAEGVELLFQVSPFYRGKTSIRPGIDYFLDEMAAIVKQNPEVTFELACYPDDDDNEAENISLTLNRGVSLQNYLIEKGINPSQVPIQPNPSSDPKLPPYDFKMAKGKRYIGSTYLVIKQINK